MKSVKCTAAMMMLCGAMVSANAASDFTKRWYGGAGIGISELEPDPNGTAVSVDKSRSSGGKIFVGYDLSERFSIEGHYADLGEAKMAPRGEVGYREFGLGGLYYLYKQHPAHTGFGFFGKAGLGKMENDTDLTYERVNDYSLFYGAGLEYGFRNGLALRGEIELYDKDAQFLTISLMKRFGGTREEQPQTAPEPEPVVLAPAPVAAELVLELEPDPLKMAPLGKLEVIYFLTNSAALTGEARAKLDRVVSELQRVPDARVEVAGHTDDRATRSYNFNLSQQRTRVVIDYLTKKGIALKRLRPAAYGEDKPAASNATEEGRSLNRRVEFRELKQ